MEEAARSIVCKYEGKRGRMTEQMPPMHPAYDIKSFDRSGNVVRLIEVKGLAAETGTILLTPNERRVAEDRRDCYWLYIVTNCAGEPVMQEPVQDPAKFPWHEVSKVQHYWLQVGDMTKPLQFGE